MIKPLPRTYARTDDALRADLLAAGAMEALHEIEARLNRDDINDRREYRALLETRCEQLGIPTRATLSAIRQDIDVMPYGPGGAL